MVRKSLYPALLVFITVSFFTFLIVYDYEIMVFLYPDRAVKLDIQFASGFSSFEKLGLNIIIVLIPLIPAIIAFMFEYSRLNNIKN